MAKKQTKTIDYDINDLIPLERNPFKTNDPELAKLQNSIKEFEKMLSIRKIVIDEKNEIIGGNKRYFALKKLGYKLIPENWVHKVTNLTAEEKKQFIIKDNLHPDSEWDLEILSDWDLEQLEDWGLDIEETEEFESKESNDLSNNIEETFKVEAECINEKEQEILYNKLINEGYTCRLLTL
ncbi:MAG: ParB N-terminal domain-containing protein [Deltaproteobacteria bacterium]|nr:ParB N-terminal domain-containing protein [Deltaproteobacteria bacterium]